MDSLAKMFFFKYRNPIKTANSSVFYNIQKFYIFAEYLITLQITSLLQNHGYSTHTIVTIV